jgi:hypothetical protein
LNIQTAQMSQVNFKRLFGVLFTVFIIIIVLVFILIAISEKLSIGTAVVLFVTPLAIRYVFYKIMYI